MNDLEYLTSLPSDSEYSPPERIVCAANAYYFSDNTCIFVVGTRHYDSIMWNTLDLMEEIDMSVVKEVQGFITSKRKFLDRKEAWKIALEQRQIVRRVGGDTAKGGTLYSENLY